LPWAGRTIVMGAQMRKVLAVFAALAVAAGVVVFWQPIAADPAL
jgi:hypothetical protein